MRILVVGDGHSEIHEVAVAGAFRKLGHQVETLYWSGYFKSTSALLGLCLRIQNKLTCGPRIARLNRDIIARAALFSPDLIFIYRGTHVTAATLLKLKSLLPRCKIFGYNNDDPFAPGHPRRLWQHFIQAIPAYDIVFAYRKHNLRDFIDAGAKQAELLMPWFIPEKDHPLERSSGEKYLYDVVFIGHYENDHRTAYIQALADSEINFRLFGSLWERAPKSAGLGKLSPITSAVGKDYARALCSARMALCFFSTLNRDTYTRRCFEIPATKTLLLCEFSEDVAKLFKEGEEADYFRTPEEMMAKIRKYLNDDRLREAVAEAGFKRVHQDGHDVVSRMKFVISKLEDIEV